MSCASSYQNIAKLLNHLMIISLLASFSHQRSLIVVQWNLSDSKFLRISTTLLSILVHLNNAVVLMVSNRSPISTPPVPFPDFLGLFQVRQLQLVSPSPSCSIYYQFSGKILIIVCLLAFFFFCFVICRSGNIHWVAIFFFWLSLGLQAEIMWSICMSKFQRISSVSFSTTDSGLCRYHLRVRSKFNLLHNSYWIIFPTQSCLVLSSICASLLHWLYNGNRRLTRLSKFKSWTGLFTFPLTLISLWKAWIQQFSLYG